MNNYAQYLEQTVKSYKFFNKTKVLFIIHQLVLCHVKIFYKHNLYIFNKIIKVKCYKHF